MREALRQASRAYKRDEVPVGAVVILDGRIIGRGYNQSISRHDPTAHAEIMALRKAAQKIGNYRLTGATLYCTLEPCAMCAAALIWARIRVLVYGAADPKAGAVESKMHLFKEKFWNHRVDVVSGILEEQSRDLLRQFFASKRGDARKIRI
jgi:tRNA(adenine34) deaminase